MFKNNHQKQEKFGIRTFKVGVCSTLLAVSFLGANGIYADENQVSSSTPSTSETTPSSNTEATNVAATASPETAATPTVTPETSNTGAGTMEASAATSQNQSSTVDKTAAAPAATSSEVTSTVEEVAENSIQNGDFSETKPAKSNWSTAGEAATNWDNPWIPSTTKKENGQTSVQDGKLVVEATDTYRVGVSQIVEIDSSKQYQFSYDAETENVKGIGIRARLRSLTAEKKDFNPQVAEYTDPVNSTNTKHVEKLYAPTPETKYVKIELFFENSVGKASFDNVSLVEYKEPEKPKEEVVAPVVETGTVAISSDKAYVTNDKDARYEVADSQVARVENGIIYAVAPGSTQVSVYKDNTKVSDFTLTISEHEKTVFDELKANWEDISLANERYNAEDTEMKTFLKRLEDGIVSSLDKWQEPTKTATTIFKDSDFTKSNHLTTVYRRLEQMAQVFENPSSTYYHNRDLLDKVRSGMDWLYTNVYNENKEIVGNWWDYEIGTPRAVVDVLIYMNKYFSQEEINKYTEPITKFVPDTTMIRSATPTPVPAVGGNQTDISKVAILQGALRNDAERVRAGVYGLTTIMNFVDKGEGFYKDGSFIDHTNVPYTGAYGNVLIEGFSQLLPVIQPTEFALKEESTNILYEWIDKAFMPIVVRGELMDMTRGRSISRATGESHTQAVEILRSLARIAATSDPVNKAKLQSFVKDQVQSDTYNDAFRNLKSYKDIALFHQLLEDDSILAKTPETYIAAFNNMDKFVYNNAESGYTFALSMYSDKTQNYEDMNNENRRGWYTADGMVYLYNGDLSHYSNNYWATVDPYHLPGTIETNGAREDGSGEVTLPSKFVGASQLGNNLSTIAMDFTNWNKELTARKAWVVLGDKIVFLGTDVQHTSDQGAVTTIENRKLLGDKTYTYYVNGQVVDLSSPLATDKTHSFYLTNGEEKQSIGYVFLTDLSTKAAVESRTGKWSDINYGQSKNEVSNSFITLTHDQAKESSNFAYVMVANKSLEDVEKLASSISILVQDKDTQLVYDAEQKVWGLVKYTDDVYTVDEKVTITKAGIYTIKKENDSYLVSRFNPETKDGEQSVSAVSDKDTVSLATAATAAYPSTIWKVMLADEAPLEPETPAEVERDYLDASGVMVWVKGADAKENLKLDVKKVVNPLDMDAQVYDLTFTKDQQPYAIREEAVVILPVDEKRDVKDVLYLLPTEEGVVTESLPFVEREGHVFFKASHFSLYALVYYRQSDQETKTSDNSEKAQDVSSHPQSIDTAEITDQQRSPESPASSKVAVQVLSKTSSTKESQVSPQASGAVTKETADTLPRTGENASVLSGLGFALASVLGFASLARKKKEN